MLSARRGPCRTALRGRQADRRGVVTDDRACRRAGEMPMFADPDGNPIGLFT
jgi:hypothetical protein